MAASSISFASSSSSSARSRAVDPPSSPALPHPGFLLPNLLAGCNAQFAASTSPAPEDEFLPGEVTDDVQAQDVYFPPASACVAQPPVCVFDAASVTQTVPWWTLLPAPVPHAGAQLAQSFVDEYAELRRRQCPPPPPLLPPLSASAYTSFVTPPSMTMMEPTEQQQQCVDTQDTPTELLEAAAVALLASSSSAAHHPSPAPLHLSSSTGPIRTSHYAHTSNDLYALFHMMEPSHEQALACAALPHSSHNGKRSRSSSDLSLGSNSQESTDPAHAGMHYCRWHACHEIFTSAQALTEHVSDDHIARRQDAYHCYWTGCKRIDHVFRQRDKIMVHMRLHTNDRRFRCPVPGCGREFSRADSYEEHRRVHSAAGKEARCDVSGCGRKYFHAKSLRKHQRMAHGMSFSTDARPQLPQ